MVSLLIISSLIYGLLIFLLIRKKLFSSDGILTVFEKKVIYAMITCIYVLIMFSPIIINRLYLSYPLNYDSFNINKNPYALLFEGFQNGHLYLNVNPDPKLAIVSNPYNPSIRKGAEVLWDFCYYNQHYYVYFGLSPVILYYYPIYLLTFGHFIPTYYFVNDINLILSIGGSILALYQTYKYFAKNFNKKLFILGCVGLFLIGGYLFLAISEPMYNTPILVATTSIYYLYYFAFVGVNKNNKLALALMAFTFVVILASRPTLTLFILPLFILLIPYLVNKEFKKHIFNLIPCFATLLVGVTLVFLYNYFRFESPFDFGNNYQLTVSDVSLNKFHSNGIKPALHYYLFQKCDIKNNQIVFVTARKNIADYNLGYYVYTYPTFGLLTIPASYLIILGLVNKKYKLIIFNSIIILLTFFLAIFDFSYGGVHIRYLMDMLPMFIFASILSMLCFDDIIPSKYKSIYFTICLIILVISSYYVISAFISERLRYNNF